MGNAGIPRQLSSAQGHNHVPSEWQRASTVFGTILIPMLYNFRTRYVGLNQIQWGREKTKPKARPLNLAERTTVGKQER